MQPTKNISNLKPDDIATTDADDKECVHNKILILEERVNTLERMLFRILDGLELDYPGIGYGEK
tara:strand:- start:717 stop:908 length:192 start_codon:yes stop_codon:yes gene_type:complete